MRKSFRRTPLVGRIIAGVLGLIMTVPLATLFSCSKNQEPVYGKGVTFVAIDINPSVELLLDKNDTVVSVYAANEDAEIMLYNSDGILGESIDDAAVRLAELAEESRTIVFYESPFRVVKCLEQLSEVFGADRMVAVSRELTKKFEQTVRGTLAEVAAHFKSHQPKGEFVIVLAGKGLKSRAAEVVEEDIEEDEQ